MADQAAPVTADAWAHAAVETVDLVSGAGTVRIRPTTLVRAVIGGRIPNDRLRSVAQKAASKGVDFAEWDEDEVRDWEAFRDWLIADCVLEPKITAEFVSQPSDPAEATEHMPAGDREQLYRVAAHEDLPQKLGLLALASFRLGAGLAGPSSNGGGEGDATE